MSVTIRTFCQVCGGALGDPFFNAGHLPLPNAMRRVGEREDALTVYPTALFACKKCCLVQLGLQVSPDVVFPPDYAYRSGTTQSLKDNFQDLVAEACRLYPSPQKSLVVDLGSNDGTLLERFRWAGFDVLGVEPTAAAEDAIAKGIHTYREFFMPSVVKDIRLRWELARIVTACNVFAHMPHPHDVCHLIADLLQPGGMFISESHYLPGLLENIQYDTIYSEHLRYYSLTSLTKLLGDHGMEVNFAKKIPTHGGSIRVYASKHKTNPVHPDVDDILRSERGHLDPSCLASFRHRVVQSKLDLMAILARIKNKGDKIYGVGAPSRSVTLANYVGLDAGIIDCIAEVDGSPKIGHYLPGTDIPIVPESKLLEDRPEWAFLFSWHIADELEPKLRAKGFKGGFIVPLPVPVARHPE